MVQSSYPSDRKFLPDGWHAINGVMDVIMVWWRFVLILSTVLIVSSSSGGPTQHRPLLAWLILYGVYATVALWLSVAFPKAYHRKSVRILRILVDMAAITATLFIDETALRFLWIFYAMRILAGLKYFDHYEWLLMWALSSAGIVAATILWGFAPGSIGLIIAKTATLAVLAAVLYYLHRLLPRLFNADYVAATSLELLKGLDRQQILEQVAFLVREGIPLAESVVIHTVSNDDEMSLVAAHAVGVDVSQLGRSRMQVGQGLAGWALRERTVLNVGDVLKDSRFQRGPTGSPPLVSLLVAPMYMADRDIGTISVNSSRRKAFDDRDAQFLRTAASQAALALSHNRLYEARRRQRQQLTQILNASLTINPLQPLDRLLDQLAAAVCQYSGFRMAAVNLIDRASQTISVAATAGLPPAAREKLMAQKTGLEQLAPLLHESFRVSSSYFVRHSRTPDGLNLDDYIYVADLPAPKPGEWHREDILLVPIMERTGLVLGYLSVDDPEDRQLPSFESVQVLEVLARLVGSMVHTGKLYQELQQQSAEEAHAAQLLALLSRIGTITSTLDSLERTLHLHLTGITAREGLQYNRAILFRLESDGRTLTGVMAIGQVDEPVAHQIWERMVAEKTTLEQYLEEMQAGSEIEWTDLHWQMRGVQIEIGADGPDAFSEVLASKNHQIVNPASAPNLPRKYLELAAPVTPTVVIPLLVGNRPLGLLVCDNKFSRDRPTNLNLLLHFASRMAAMMENDRLDREAREAAGSIGWQQGAYEERQQLHDKLHDLLGLLQTRIRWDIEEAVDQIENGDAEGATDALEDGLAVLSQVAEPLKEMVEELRPPIFSNGDLLEELRRHAPRLRPGQIIIEGPKQLALPPALLDQMHLVGKEGLTNAAKYSGAKSDPQIQITLCVEQAIDGTVQMTVSDNGVGFERTELDKKGRYGGLSRLHQRVEKAGGKCYINSEPGSGTRLRVIFAPSAQNAVAQSDRVR